MKKKSVTISTFLKHIQGFFKKKSFNNKCLQNQNTNKSLSQEENKR